MTLSAPLSFYLCYLVWLAIFTAGVQKLDTTKRLLLTVLIAVALLMPLADITPILYLRGVFGDFSPVHALWALAGFVNHVSARRLIDIPVSQKAYLSLLLLLTALAFYPSALGSVDFDAYRLGFEPTWLLATLAVVVLLSWAMRQYFAAIAISVAVLAWSQRTMESNNLWDYLFDPLLVLYCAVWCIAMTVMELVRAYRADGPETGASTRNEISAT